MALDVRHDTRRERFSAPLGGGQEATLDYSTPRQGVVDLESTVVPRQLRGKGFGRQLVRHVLDFARSNGLRVVPTCPFVARVIEEHPEYRDLVA